MIPPFPTPPPPPPPPILTTEERAKGQTNERTNAQRVDIYDIYEASPPKYSSSMVWLRSPLRGGCILMILMVSDAFTDERS